MPVSNLSRSSKTPAVRLGGELTLVATQGDKVWLCKPGPAESPVAATVPMTEPVSIPGTLYSTQGARPIPIRIVSRRAVEALVQRLKAEGVA